MKRNALTLLLALAMLLTPAFTACSDATDNAETTAPTPGVSAESYFPNALILSERKNSHHRKAWDFGGILC